MINRKWSLRFLLLAQHVSTWSKDPSTQCGAVIVDPETRIVIGLGYNGFPRGVEDRAERLANENRETEKYPRIVHGEMNAIFNANGPVRGATLFVWPFMTCSDCAKNVIQAGIRCVVHPEVKSGDPEAQARWEARFALARQMYEEAGVTVVPISQEEIDAYVQG